VLSPEFSPRHHHPKIDNVVIVTLQHYANDVLSDVMNVALDRGHDDPALRLCAGRFFASINGIRYATAFFITRALLTTWAKHFARSKKIADHTHPAISGPSITSSGRWEFFRASSVSTSMYQRCL